MRVLLALSLLLSVPALDAAEGTRFQRFAPAVNATLEFERLPDDPGRLARIQRQLRETTPLVSSSGNRLQPSAVILNAPMNSFVIPAAGSLQGGGGTFFRSDVTLVNYRETHQDVLIIWLERGVEGSNAPTFRATLDADEPPATYQDFVAGLELSGLGSLLIAAVDSNDDVDPDGSIDGFSRIWTNQPGAEGTVSQPFPPVNPSYLIDQFEAVAMGLRHDADFRTNAGITNLDTSAHTFNVYVFGERDINEFTITVPALSMMQSAIPAGDYGAVTLIFEPANVLDVDFGWSAYGSSTDNLTGDGWVSVAAVVGD